MTDPTLIDLARAWAAPSWSHPCGCDGLGRDVCSRLLAGGGTSIGLTLLTLAVALGLGSALGSLAAWRGGRIDALVMRGADLMLGFPELALALATALLVGPGSQAVILTLALVWWPGLARLTRALIRIQLSERYVLAAVALGAPPRHILWRHTMPHLAGPLAVRATLSIGPLIAAETTLSFLGLGVQEPAISWGTLIRDGLAGLRSGPHLIAATTGAVFLFSLGCALLADRLRDTLDPRNRNRRRPRHPSSSEH